MSAAVITLPTRAAVDQAWQEYRDLCRELVENPTRLTDRGFQEHMASVEHRWKQLYLEWAGRA